MSTEQTTTPATTFAGPTLVISDRIKALKAEILAKLAEKKA